jgi:hypothetical protein
MKKTKRKISITAVIIIVLVFVFLEISGFYYDKFQKIKNNPDLARQEEINILVNKIGKIMKLPADEEPTLITVTNGSALENQRFFKNVQNGDKIILYQEAQKGILFRPSQGKIIETVSLKTNEK